MRNSLLRRLATVFTSGMGVRVGRQPQSVAAFIDADGVSPHNAAVVLDHLDGVGLVTSIRWFGNISAGKAPAWAPLFKRQGIVVRHMPTLVSGKNASDVALAVDLMDRLTSGNADIYAIIASDTDFTPLALRVRESKKTVLGFGSPATPAPFRAACTAFEEIRDIDPVHIRETRKRSLFWTLQPSDADALIVRALGDLGGDERQVPLAELAKRLSEDQEHSFDARIYRRRNLTELLRDLPTVHLIVDQGSRYVRLANGPRGNG